jgi:hypothetical protein
MTEAPWSGASQARAVCSSCNGSGEIPTDYGPADCPDCGGAGELPPRSVLVQWRARDIERAVEHGFAPHVHDTRWLLDELSRARTALTEIIALAHDARDPDEIAMRIRYVANRALGLYASRGRAEKN